MIFDLFYYLILFCCLIDEANTRRIPKRGDPIDPELKEKKRAHLMRFFGERPQTQELFPIETGVLARISEDKPINARRETDPERMDEFVKELKKEKLARIFGVRPMTRDMTEAIRVARVAAKTAPPAPMSPTAFGAHRRSQRRSRVPSQRAPSQTNEKR